MFDGYANQGHQDPNPAPPQQKVLRFDKGYIKTLPGILKIVQLVSYFIGIIITLMLKNNKLCLYRFVNITKFRTDFSSL